MLVSFFRTSLAVASTLLLACGPMDDSESPPPPAPPPQATPPTPGPTPARVIPVVLSLQFGRVDAKCPNNTSIIGGGCSCQESASFIPSITLAAPVHGSQLGYANGAFACGCAASPDGRFLGTTARALCLEGATLAPDVQGEP